MRGKRYGSYFTYSFKTAHDNFKKAKCKVITLSNYETLIAQALETPEGRVAHSQAMVEPIRRALEYQALGRRLMMVDPLPEGAFSRTFDRNNGMSFFDISIVNTPLECMIMMKTQQPYPPLMFINKSLQKCNGAKSQLFIIT